MKIVSFFALGGACCFAVAALGAPFQSANGYRFTPPSGFVSRPNTNFSGKFGSAKGGSTNISNQSADLFIGPRGATFMVVSRQLPARLTLPQLLQGLPSQMEGATAQNLKIGSKALPGSGVKTHVVSKGYTSVGKAKAIFVTCRVNQGASVPTFLARTVITLRGQQMWVFVCSARASDFPRLTPAFNRALSGVKWTK